MALGAPTNILQLDAGDLERKVMRKVTFIPLRVVGVRRAGVEFLPEVLSECLLRAEADLSRNLVLWDAACG
jgi:hypothetical protein